MSYKLLVDTRALLWYLEDDPRLPGPTAEMIDDLGNVAAVSAASVWEIAIKMSIGKLTAPDDLPDKITEARIAILPVEFEHAWACRELPLKRHKDPFDRMLAAQALTEGFDVVSTDASFGEYGIRRHWD